MRDHIYEYDTLVCGSGINTLLYCFYTASPLILTSPCNIFHFETIKGDFSFLGLSSKEVLSAELWNRLYMILSLSGKIVNPLPTQNLRMERGKMVYITDRNKKITAEYNKLLKFETEQEICMVYDWFAVKSGGKHNFEKLKDPKNFFVQLLRFHPSMRKNVNGIKDVIAVSKVNKANITDFDHSETMARLKATKMMKEAGIRGRSNGTNKKGYKLHYAIKLEHSHREVVPKIKYRMSVKKIMKIELNKGAMWNLTKNLFIPKTLST
mgnify:CR=1 FL=1